MTTAWLALALVQAGDAAWFTDVTERSLPGVTIQCGALEKDWILAVNGGGIGLSDLNGDGHLDLVVVDCGDVEAYRRG